MIMKFVVLLFARRQEKKAAIAELITQGFEAGLVRLLMANKIIAAAANYNLQLAGLEPLNGYAGKSFSDLPAPVTLLWLVFGLVAGENFVDKT